MKRINKTTLFLLLTFILNYLLATIYFLSGGTYLTVSGTIMALFYMFIPMCCVLFVEKIVYKEKILSSLQISFKINKWFVIGWLITPIISVGAFGISLLFPDVHFSPDMTGIVEKFEAIMPPEQIEEMKNSINNLPVHPFWISVFQGLIAGVTINAVAGFGEELGWRGFLLNQFKNMSFMKASLIIGFIWGIWHAPLILQGHNYPQHPQSGVFMMIIWCTLLTPLFLYITIKSRSVIAAAIMHGTLNGTAGLAIMVIDGGNDLTTGITGLAGFISLAIVLFGFFVYDKWITKERIITNKISNYL